MRSRWWSAWLCGVACVSACSQPAADTADAAPAEADVRPRGPYPDATLRWGFYDSFYQVGNWVVVNGDGSVGYWIHVGERITEEFPPDEQVQLAAGVTDELFGRWEAIDNSGLPRPGTPRSVGVRLYVRMCAECEPVTLDYWEAEQVEPDLAPLRAWFEEYADPDWPPPQTP